MAGGPVTPIPGSTFPRRQTAPSRPSASVTLSSSATSCRIGGIALGALDVALHVAWRHHPDGMTEPGQLARPIMRRATGLHADQAGWDLAEKLDDLFAAQLPGNDDLPVLVDAVDLKDILGE